METLTAVFTAAAAVIYWFMWVMGAAEVKGKRVVDLKMGFITRDIFYNLITDICEATPGFQVSPLKLSPTCDTSGDLRPSGLLSSKTQDLGKLGPRFGIGAGYGVGFGFGLFGGNISFEMPTISADEEEARDSIPCDLLPYL